MIDGSANKKKKNNVPLILKFFLKGTKYLWNSIKRKLVDLKFNFLDFNKNISYFYYSNNNNNNNNEGSYFPAVTSQVVILHTYLPLQS